MLQIVSTPSRGRHCERLECPQTFHQLDWTEGWITRRSNCLHAGVEAQGGGGGSVKFLLWSSHLWASCTWKTRDILYGSYCSLFFQSPDPICQAKPAAKGRGSPPSRPRWRAGRRWGRRHASRRPAPTGLCARGLSARLRPCTPRSSRRSSGSLCRRDTRRHTCHQSPASRWSCSVWWWCAETSHPAPSSSDEKERALS